MSANMQRRHYELIADIIKQMKGDFAEHYETAHHFADELAKGNSKFNKDKFLRACGVNGGS